jgi:predicted branched-subunit amino acid permease
MMADPSFRRGLRDTGAVAIAFVLIGVGFGALAVEAGLPPWVAVLSSCVIVSGAAQFALVGLLPAGPVAVLVTVTGLALRHVPMSAVLARLVGGEPLPTRLRLAWVLVDETFGLTMHAVRRQGVDPVAYKTGADLVLYTSWVAGTVGGVLLGNAVDVSALGADVLFALLFLGLAAPLVETRGDLAVALLAVAATLVAVTVLPPAWQITGAAFTAAAVGALVRTPSRAGTRA